MLVGKLYCAAMIIIACSGLAKAGAITITDSSFETPVQSAGGFSYAPAGAGTWTFSAQSGNNGAGVAAANSPWFSGSPPNGNQAAFIQNQGQITQALSGFTVGQSYTLSFYLAQRYFAQLSAAYPIDPLAVAIGGTTLGTYSPAGTTFGLYSAQFIATSTSELLSFSGVNASSSSNDYASILDNVSIVTSTAAAVPEPTSIALFGVGLLATGYAARRRQIRQR